jgi:hypothetical protein
MRAARPSGRPSQAGGVANMGDQGVCKGRVVCAAVVTGEKVRPSAYAARRARQVGRARSAERESGRPRRRPSRAGQSMVGQQPPGQASRVVRWAEQQARPRLFATSVRSTHLQVVERVRSLVRDASCFGGPDRAARVAHRDAVRDRWQLGREWIDHVARCRLIHLRTRTKRGRRGA